MIMYIRYSFLFIFASSYSFLLLLFPQETFIDRTSVSCVRLREGAIPEIFPDHPSHLQKTVTERRPLKRNTEITNDLKSPTKKKIKKDLEKTSENLAITTEQLEKTTSKSGNFVLLINQLNE